MATEDLDDQGGILLFIDHTCSVYSKFYSVIHTTCGKINALSSRLYYLIVLYG
jgi:hypothetical protein